MSIEAAFMGTLAKDAEPKTSKAGKQYLSFRVRVQDGESAQWIGVRLFGDCASDLMSKAMRAGCPIYVEGRLSLDEWEAPDGSKKSGLSCMSWFARPSAIGDRKPPRERTSNNRPAERGGGDFYSDPVGF
jgi:single-stranded DNA-binding protein